MRKKRIWIAAIIVMVGVGLSLYIWLNHQEPGAMTVSELASQGSPSADSRLRVEGKVNPGSIEWDNKSQVMSFVLTDDKGSLNVAYKGIVPENFKPGAQVTIEGRYSPDGAFEAVKFGSDRSLCAICH